MQSKKFKIATLGCRTNQYESQAYSDQLKGLGYSPAEEREDADICIVNTCTVTEMADKTSLYQIRRLARENPDAKIVVTGCLAERKKEEIALLPQVSYIVPNEKKHELLQPLFLDQSLPEFSIKQFDDHTRAFVKVQDGCNSFCSYCIIPYVRGRSRSRTISEVVSEVRELVDNGYKEVVLTGINIGDFNGGKKRYEHPDSLADLIRAVDQVEGLDRIRISSIDPDEVDDNLIDAILQSRHVCPSLHIVLQSGSNTILKRMNRKYSIQDLYATIDKLLLAEPEFTFTTDVIVGFPGETESDFQQTLEVISSVQFVKVHMFPYSSRPGTKAALFPDHVPDTIIQERKHRLLHHAEQVSFKKRANAIGKTYQVLVESSRFGHTKNFLPVHVPDAPKNSVVDVIIRENTPEGLKGDSIYA